MGVDGSNLTQLFTLLCCPEFSRASSSGAQHSYVIESECFNTTVFWCVLPPGPQQLEISLKSFPPKSGEELEGVDRVRGIGGGWIMKEQVCCCVFNGIYNDFSLMATQFTTPPPPPPPPPPTPPSHQCLFQIKSPNPPLIYHRD